MRTIGAIVVGSIHMLAAITWLGGAIFAVWILGPASKRLDPPQAGMISQAAGQIFTVVAWSSVAVLLLTGLVRSAAIGALNPNVLFNSTYGYVLLAKIALVIVIIVLGVMIFKAAAALGAAGAKGEASPVMAAAANRLRQTQVASIYVGIVIVVLAVALRVLGVPES